MPRLEPVMTATLPVRSNGVFFIVRIPPWIVLFVIAGMREASCRRERLRTEQSSLLLAISVDCFAALAMTLMGRDAYPGNDG